MGTQATRRRILQNYALRARIEAYVKKLADPVVSGIEPGQRLEVKWPDPLLLVAALMPEQLVERIFDAAQRMAQEPLPPEERPARIDKLEHDLEKLSHVEEALVAEAIANGENVSHRYDVPPPCVLGVRVKEDVWGQPCARSASRSGSSAKGQRGREPLPSPASPGGRRTEKKRRRRQSSVSLNR